jgi:hypothetical protein
MSAGLHDERRGGNVSGKLREALARVGDRRFRMNLARSIEHTIMVTTVTNEARKREDGHARRGPKQSEG